MPNLYGVANAAGFPFFATSFGGDVACPANVPTSIYTTSSPLVAPSQGYFYAMAWVMLAITSGATLTNGLNLGIAIGAGSFTNYMGIGSYGLLVSGTSYLTVFTASPVSQVAWQGAGSTVSLAISNGNQALTVKGGSNAMFCLFRAPDQ